MNGTINLKKLSTKMLDAISTLNTDISNLTTSIPSQIKTNNRQTLATVEQNAEAASRAYATGEYLAVNGKLYKALTNIAQGTALEQNVNIEWVLLGDEVNKIRNDLKQGAFRDVANDLTTSSAGSNVLDAYQGKLLNDKITTLNNTLKIETPTITFNSGIQNTYNLTNVGNVVKKYGKIVNFRFSANFGKPIPSGQYVALGTISVKPIYDQYFMTTTSISSTSKIPFTILLSIRSTDGTLQVYRYDNLSTPTSIGWLRVTGSYICQ